MSANRLIQWLSLHNLSPHGFYTFQEEILEIAANNTLSCFLTNDSMQAIFQLFYLLEASLISGFK